MAALFGDEMLAVGTHAEDVNLPMHEICPGVSYHTVAREWRFRFTGRDVRLPPSVRRRFAATARAPRRPPPWNAAPPVPSPRVRSRARRPRSTS